MAMEQDPRGGTGELDSTALADSGILVDGPVGEDSPEEASRLLREALRRAPLPSLSGLAFEIMGLAWVFGGALGLLCVSALVPVERRVSTTFESLLPGAAPEGLLIWLVAVVSTVLFSVRVAAGLARIASKGKGQSAGANAVRAFRLGGRIQVSAFAVWLQIFGMMACATVVLLAPFVLLSSIVQVEVLRPLWVVLDGLGLTFALCYGAALGAVQELAMASLVRHERGTGSAILHAWRLMRNKRLTASRMAVVEMATRVAIVATAWAVGELASVWLGIGQLLVFGALVGGLRCQAWALAFPRIGGLEAETTQPLAD